MLQSYRFVAEEVSCFRLRKQVCSSLLLHTLGDSGVKKWMIIIDSFILFIYIQGNANHILDDVMSNQ